MSSTIASPASSSSAAYASSPTDGRLTRTFAAAPCAAASPRSAATPRSLAALALQRPDERLGRRRRARGTPRAWAAARRRPRRGGRAPVDAARLLRRSSRGSFSAAAKAAYAPASSSARSRNRAASSRPDARGSAWSSACSAYLVRPWESDGNHRHEGRSERRGHRRCAAAAGHGRRRGQLDRRRRATVRSRNEEARRARACADCRLRPCAGWRDRRRSRSRPSRTRQWGERGTGALAPAGSHRRGPQPRRRGRRSGRPQAARRSWSRAVIVQRRERC